MVHVPGSAGREGREPVSAQEVEIVGPNLRNGNKADMIAISERWAESLS